MKRILLKLSGEALATEEKKYDDVIITGIARQVKSLLEQGYQIGIVIGGGNYWRGRSSENIDRTKADQIGMLATIMNCIYVSELFRSEKIPPLHVLRLQNCFLRIMRWNVLNSLR